MRKLLTVLAILGLAIGFTAVTASADGFTVTFSVDSGVLGTSPIGGGGMSPDVPVTFNLTSPSLSLTGESGIVNFFTAANGGLFGLTFTLNGNIFMFDLFGSVGGFTDGTPPVLTTGGPFVIDPTSFLGEFDPATGNALGGFNVSSGTVIATAMGSDIDYVADGTFVSIPGVPPPSVPEPSTLVLLGSGFLALGGLTRKHVIARFFN